MNDFRIVRRNRRTGSEIEVCTAASQGFDDFDGEFPWVTVCWTHGTLMNHRVRSEADRAATYPDDWCEDSYGEDGTGETNTCRGVWEAKEQAADQLEAK